jgi:hypothetical protein
MSAYVHHDARKKLTAIAITIMACAIAIPAGAGAATSTANPVRVLKFVSRTTRFTPIGFPASQNTPPPIGARYIIQLALFNQTAQFGRPAGARVGSVELDCTIATSRRSLCGGAAHLPDGYLSITGANPSNSAPTEMYAITGGVAAYADQHGQIKALNSRNGNRSSVTVTLY